MSSFDYKYAWAAWAVPSYRALPRNVRQLVIRTVRESENQIQNDDLDVKWPSEELRNAFYEIPAEILAVAARVVYFFGHWGNRKCFQKTGGYWKFANYCDQVLKDKLGMNSYAGNGMHLEVHQGMLRVCVATPNLWCWEEVNIATKAIKDKLSICLLQPKKEKMSRSEWDRFEEMALDTGAQLKKAYGPESGIIKDYFRIVSKAKGN